jgi:CrcB protein
MGNVILIGFGGFLGAVSRFGVFQLCRRMYHASSFAWGVLAVNVLGSFIIGLMLAISVKTGILARHTRAHYFFITGFLGAFTTFSTFSQDTLQYMLSQNYVAAIGNIALNVILSLVAVMLGYFIVLEGTRLFI